MYVIWLGSIQYPHFMTKKLRHREAKSFAQGHTFLPARCQIVSRKGLCVATLQLQEIKRGSVPYPETSFLPPRPGVSNSFSLGATSAMQLLSKGRM